MTIVVGYWLLPALITIGVIVWWSVVMPRGNGMGDAFTGVLALGAGVIGILVAWLAYFAALAFAGGGNA